MRKITLFFGLMLALFSFSQAQEMRKCGLEDILHNDLMNNATLQSTYLQEISEAVNGITAYDTTLADTDTTYTIKVVVHVVYLGNNKYENIPDDIIQSQIAALNRDFNNQNADSVNLRPFFKPFRGNAKIKFELANKAPNGQPSNGITRTQGNLGNLAGWDPISTLIWTALGIEPLKEDFFLFTGSRGKSPWPSNQYLNLYVCDLNHANRKCRTCLTLCDTCGALGGFAYPPSNAINWGSLALDRKKNDGIVIDFRFFGQNNWYAQDSTSQRFRDFYAAGRTTVHEVGHYLGLQHSWGNVLPLPGFDNGCEIDDFIDDTPMEVGAFASSLTPGFVTPCDESINTCDLPYLGQDYPDMYENYMDYSTDLCYNLFTKQQVNLMRYNLITRRGGIIGKREVEMTPTSVNYIRSKEAGISIFPNPAKDVLTLSFSKAIKSPLVVDILDITGKQVLTTKIQQNESTATINLKSLSNGVYMIQCQNNEFKIAEKIIKGL